MKLLNWALLRTRITLGMLLAVLLTVWIPTLIASNVFRHEMEAAISAQQLSAVALAANNVDQALREHICAIEELAGCLSRSQSPLDHQQRFLEDLVFLPKMFNWGIFILDAEGLIRASIPEHLERAGNDYSKFPAIKAALEHGKTMVSEPLIGKTAQQPLVAIIAPIFDSGEQVRGVVIGCTNLAKPNFLDVVNMTKYGATGDFFIISTKSRSYLASSDKRRVMQVGPPEGVNPMYDQHMAGQEGSGVGVSSRGVLELASCVRIPSADWVMASVLPVDEAFAPVSNMQRNLMMSALVLTLLLSGITWLWLQYQFRPVSEASDLLTRMSDGIQARQPLPVRRYDEIGQLAIAFNNLLARITAEEEQAVEHAANERLHKIVSHVPGVVFQYRLFPDGRACFPFASQALKDIYGVDPEDVKESIKLIRDMTHPEDRDAFFAALRASADSLGLWRFDYRICRPDGVTKWLLIDAMPEQDNGSVTWYGFISDISDAKRTEETLRFTQFAIERTSDQALWLTENGHIVYANDAASRALEFSRKELLTISVPQIDPQFPLEKYARHWHKLKKQGAMTFESILRTKSGRMFPVEVRNNYVVYDGKEYNCAFITDITARKMAEEENARLQTQLFQAQKMEAIGTLAGGIAHDFNNILSIILGYSELAKNDASSAEKYQEQLDKVLIAANRAKDLVKQILAFSRQTQVKRTPLKVQSLIREGLKMLRSSIPTTISITEEIDPDSGAVLADPTQIYQILMNLCTNAYHAMEATGGVLAVSLKTKFIDKDDRALLLQVRDGEYVELMVSDTGSGIPSHIMDKIFDPFFTTKKNDKGTGMGLAIIQGIMKDYNGSISVVSREGEGTAFQLYFPVVSADVDLEEGKLNSLETGNERILLIDDETLLAEMGKDMLEQLGYHVTVQLGSISALTAFKENPKDFDLVITDQTMPEMTGADLARQMLQIRPDIPIILCTGYSNSIDEHSAKDMGIKKFIFKPFSPTFLAKTIRNVLSNQ